MQLLECQRGKPTSSQNDERESTSLRIGDYNILQRKLALFERLNTNLELSRTLWE